MVLVRGDLLKPSKLDSILKHTKMIDQFALWYLKRTLWKEPILIYHPRPFAGKRQIHMV